MSRPSILRRRHTWRHFKENIGLLTTEALLILRRRPDLVEEEKSLNKILRLCFRSANYKLKFEYFPALDAENDEGNRPDLSWSFFNDLATNPEECEICFALECKRLGRKTKGGWNLNEQYVLEGILRFFKKEKGYGERIEIGAMVGYIQDSEFDDILHEVNENLSIHEPSIPSLTLSIEGWLNQEVSRLQHIFQRSSNPASFLLQHFWIDMRDCHLLSSKSDVQTNEKEEQLLDKIVEGKSKKDRKKQRKTVGKKNKIATNIVIQQRLLIETDTETSANDGVNSGKNVVEDQSSDTTGQKPF